MEQELKVRLLIALGFSFKLFCGLLKLSGREFIMLEMKCEIQICSHSGLTFYNALSLYLNLFFYWSSTN